MPKGKTVGTPTKKKPAPYMSKTEKGTMGVASSKTKKSPFKGAAATKKAFKATPKKQSVFKRGA